MEMKHGLALQIAAAFLLSGSVSVVILDLIDRQHLANARVEAGRIAEQHARRLDSSIQQSLSSTYALAALLRQGNGRISEFEPTARRMLQLYPGVSALQLAPGGIVSQSIPLEGNQAAIGHDLLRDEARNKEAILARTSGKLTLAGPFQLLQGGTAAAGRLPVFIPDDKGDPRFWGFVTALIRFPEALEPAGLNELLRNGYVYELWRIHPDTGARQVISASPTPVRMPVEQSIFLPNGEWVLSVAPENGWLSENHGLLGKGVAALCTLLFTLAAALIFRQPQVLRMEVERRTRELREREALLSSMNDLSSDWYWETDTEHRFKSLTGGISRIIGLQPEALVGLHRWNLATTLSAEEWDEHRAVLDRHESFRDFVYGVHADDGELRYISISGRPVFASDGSFLGYQGTGRNVTARKRAEQNLIESETRFHLLFEKAPVALSVTTDLDGYSATRWNGAWLDTFGYDPLVAQDRSGSEIGLWCDPAERERYIREATAELATEPREVRLRRADGAVRLAAVSGRIIRSGTSLLLITSYDDITDRREAENRLRESLQRLELHISGTPLAVIDWDSNFCVAAWNPAAERIFGYRHDEAIGRHASFIVPEQYRYRVDGIMKSLFDQAGGHRSTNQNITRDGQTIECEWYNAPIVDGAGKVIALSSLVQDVTERVAYMRALEHQAHHDPLTHLYNRHWLAREIDRQIHDSPDDTFSLLFIDLDRFKEINDTLGHRIGDELLVELSHRLQNRMAGQDCPTARLGGDEFAVIVSGVRAVLIAQEILQTLREPVALSGMHLEVGAGIGVARYPEDGHDAPSLMRCADIAMYHAKNSALGYSVYSPEIDTFSQDRLALMNDLRSAIRNDELVLFYQPKVNIASGCLVGHEALLRWLHPERGMIPPGSFIPQAEVTDLMHPLTLWVIEGAMHQWRLWDDAGNRLSIAINLSSRNLHDDALPDHIAMLLGTYGVDPACIEFEITESAVMDDPEMAMRILHRLRDLGVTLSIDDFGTGYSSLAYLRRLPVQKLKIDASFVMGMQSRREDRVIVESTIGLAHNLGLKVIAEGVEDAEAYRLLAELGCDEAQGYYLARPMPADLLQGWRPPRD